MGSSGWPKPAIVAMRMNPSSATWVETRKTRPFWTLATIRRPSRRPYIRVTNESSPRTRSEASRATAVPLPMATATSAWCRAGASLTPSPVTATVRPAVRAASTMRSLSSGMARATTVRLASSAARRAAGHDRTSDPTTSPPGPMPTWAAIAAAVAGWSPVTTTVWMPAPVARSKRLADPVPDGVFEVQEGQRRPGLRGVGGGDQQQPAAVPGVPLVGASTRRSRRRPGARGRSRTASGAPTTRPSSDAGRRGRPGHAVGPAVGRALGAAQRRLGIRAPACATGSGAALASSSARVNEPGG